MFDLKLHATLHRCSKAVIYRHRGQSVAVFKNVEVDPRKRRKGYGNELLTTLEVSKAIVEVRSGYCYDPEKGPKMQIRHRFNVKVEKYCYYEQALNMKNFIKRLRRRGLIGADENVKIVK